MEVSGTRLTSTEIYQGCRTPSELSEFSASSPEPSLSPSPCSREIYEGLMSPGWWDLTLRNDDTEDQDGGDYSSAANPRTRLELAAATNAVCDDGMQGPIGVGRIGRTRFQTTNLERILQDASYDDWIKVVKKLQMNEQRGVTKQLKMKLQWSTIRTWWNHAQKFGWRRDEPVREPLEPYSVPALEAF